MPFGAPKSMIEFYDCINTTARVVKREHFASFLFFSSVPLSLLPPIFFFFVCPGRENDDVESRGVRKRRQFLVARFTTSKYRRTSAELRRVSPVRIAGKSTVTSTTVSPVSILSSVRSFLPSAMAKVVHERARS